MTAPQDPQGLTFKDQSIFLWLAPICLGALLFTEQLAPVLGLQPIELYIAPVKFFFNLLSYQLLHANMTHLLSNFAVLALADALLRVRFNSLQRLGIFVVGGIAGGLSHALNMSEQNLVSLLVGASGSIYGMLGVCLVFWDSIKMRQQQHDSFLAHNFIHIVLLFMVFQQILLSQTAAGSQISYEAHVGGFLGGILLAGIPKALYRI